MGRQRLGLAHRALVTRNVRHGERRQRPIGTQVIARVDHLLGLTDRRSLAFVSGLPGSSDQTRPWLLGSGGHQLTVPDEVLEAQPPA
jgi:hypothetical protein